MKYSETQSLFSGAALLGGALGSARSARIGRIFQVPRPRTAVRKQRRPAAKALFRASRSPCVMIKLPPKTAAAIDYGTTLPGGTAVYRNAGPGRPVQPVSTALSWRAYAGHRPKPRRSNGAPQRGD